jgi:hypothetical protein
MRDQMPTVEVKMTKLLESSRWTDQDEADHAEDCKIGLAKIIASKKRLRRLKMLSGDWNALRDLQVLLNSLDALGDEIVTWCKDGREAATASQPCSLTKSSLRS